MADSTIDVLSIEVVANISNAAKAIKSLNSSVKGLQKTLEKNTSIFGNLADQVNDFSSSIAGSIDNVERLARALKDLKGVNVDKILKQANKQAGTSEAFDLDGGATYDSMSVSADNLSTSFTGLYGSMALISSASTQIQTSMNAIVPVFVSYKQIVDELGGSFATLMSTTGAIIPVYTTFSKIVDNIDAKMHSIAGLLGTNQMALPMKDSSMSNIADNSALNQLADTEERARTATQNLTGSFEKKNKRLREQTSALKKDKKATQEAAKAAESASTRFSNFAKALGRIVFYRIVRVIMSEINNAFKEGLENVYKYSAALEGLDSGGAKEVLDDLATSVNQMKNAMGSAFYQFIVALKPVLDVIIDLVYQLANAISYLFALLSGQGFYYKAKRAAKEFIEDTDKENKSAKALQKTLMGFDEINNITTSSGGSGGGGSDAIEQFEKVKIEPIDFPDFKDKLLIWFGDFKKLFDEALEFVWDLVPEFAYAFEYAWDLIPDLVPQLEIIFQRAWDWISEWKFPLEIYLVPDWNLELAFDTVRQKVKDTATDIATNVAPVFTSVWDALKVGAEAFVNGIDLAFQGVGQALGYTVKTVSAAGEGMMKTFRVLYTNVGTIFSNLANGIAGLWHDGLQYVVDVTAEAIPAIGDAFVKLGNGIIDVIWNAMNGLVKTVVGGLKAVFDKVKDAAEAVGETVGNWFADNSDTIKKVATVAGIVGLVGLSIGLAPYTGGASLAALAFATGGFPEDGMFFANHSELVGKFSNGKTAVANNEQIVEGISAGVSNANIGVIYAIEELIRAVENGSTIEIDGREVFKTVAKYDKQYYNTTGNSKFAY